MEQALAAFGMTLLAGLATGIGGFISLFTKRDNKRFLCISLGFSAGVMIYVSMIEIFTESQRMLIGVYREKWGTTLTVAAFFGGMLIIAFIDKLIPKEKNPHEIFKTDEKNKSERKLMRTGLFTALAIAIHNFPEGMATFISALREPSVAIPIVFAIAIHNIPEGIAVAAPIYYASGSKRKAFLYALLSGFAEPVGALVGYLILLPFMNDTLFGVLFAAVAGIMVFISFDELLPTAREYGKHHLSIYGLIGGMLVMAISLIAFM